MKENKKSPFEKEYEIAWDKYSEEELKRVFDLSKRFIDFMSRCKTERECVQEFTSRAEKLGYKNLQDLIKQNMTLKPGDKVYAEIMGKTIAFFVIGKKPLEDGLRILGAHVDSPRLDLKQNPLYEDADLALFETHYYGGIKKYQWVTLPLAIHGVVVKKDGTLVNIVIGEDEDDPVLGVSDLLIHLAKDQMKKTMAEGVEGEKLNILVGSIPMKANDETKDRVKHNILKLLNEKYDIVEEDFVSAELEVVPAGKARHYGLDKSMIMAYGQDDRVCAYTSFEAMLEIENPEKTCVTLLVDKEEIGSVGATGMTSKFFENTLAEILNLLGDYSELKLRRALANSKMLSADVSAAFDPNYPDVMEKKNSASFGKGIVFNKYTGSRGKSGSNDANPEFMAELRKIMDKHNVSWQTAELGKVDQGGGGTIAYILASYGMEVIDAGIALHNMHAPWEISSKADLFEAKKAYKAFLQEA
ncbi:MAG: aminopeptidase [Tepidanaerobacteraceae bacterium]